MNRLAISAAIALALVTGSLVIGYRRGAADCRAAHQQEALRQIEAGRKLDAARIAVERARYTLSRQLEEKAYADPVSVPQCLGPKRVLRLNSLR
ncbi:hypothetical protein [Tritonibacter mobilis]|uniref:hypothetical protein n=1 Tax=Tritonibacter mobilis TaxID=379347 RepID=UPI001C08EC56|nr:hypothetical protein [Tritonibacter mobilis]MBU3035940.1 hypothetical protein [Tritonibacter mobilis]WHQ85360.1 hypothetical protein OMR53_21770 [Tritonibacter mobilis]